MSINQVSCHFLTPALMAVNSERVKLHLSPLGSWEGRIFQKDGRAGCCGGLISSQKPLGEKKLGKPDLICVGMREILHGETTISVLALQQSLC